MSESVSLTSKSTSVGLGMGSLRCRVAPSVTLGASEQAWACWRRAARQPRMRCRIGSKASCAGCAACASAATLPAAGCAERRSPHWRGSSMRFERFMMRNLSATVRSSSTCLGEYEKGANEMAVVERRTAKVDRDEVFLEYTKSICPVCKTVVDAEVNVRDNRVILRKR